MRKEFEPNKLNGTGNERLMGARGAFSRLLDTVERLAPSASRARSLVVTKLQEASHWASRAIAEEPLHQSNVPDSVPLGALPLPSDGEIESLARDFYAAYMVSCEGKNYQGNPCPQWQELPEAIRGHWRACARRAYALRDALRGDVPMHQPGAYELAADNPEQYERKRATWFAYRYTGGVEHNDA